MTLKSEGWWSDEVERIMLGKRLVGSYMEQEIEEEGILKQLWDNNRRVRKRLKRKIKMERKIKKEKKEL